MGFPFGLPWGLPGDWYVPPVTSFGPLTYNNQHVPEALKQLLQQFRERPKIEGLVATMVYQVQELEAALWQILLASDLDLAANAQLDGIGDLVGEPRRSRTDTVYRAAIRVRILINRSTGQHPDLLRIFTTYVGAASASGLVRLRETSPAALSLEIFAVAPSLFDLRDITRAIKPGGVFLEGMAATNANTARWGWSGGAVAGVTGANNGAGWSGDSSIGGKLAMRI